MNEISTTTRSGMNLWGDVEKIWLLRESMSSLQVENRPYLAGAKFS